MVIEIGICSFSFHHMLAEGRQDVFGYIRACRDLGATQLDPWNAHLSAWHSGANVLHAGRNPDAARLEPGDDAFIERVATVAADAGLPFGCIAVDGAHVYEADPAAREANRQRALRWIAIARRLGARQVRIDAGGPPEMPADVFAAIVAGYRPLLDHAGEGGIEVLVENHWGPTPNPDNLLRLLDAVPGLGLLFDTNNWLKGRQEEGWRRCAGRARACHVKTFGFDAAGNDPSVDLALAMRVLRQAGYAGSWGVESVLRDGGDEIEHARRTITLIRRELARTLSVH